MSAPVDPAMNSFLYLKDILSRLPTQPNSRIGELLPHRWAPEISA